MATEFSSQLFLELARENALKYGQPLTVTAETVSTNDDALAALKSGSPEGAVFVAERQTGGRGRHGRQWQSVAGHSLTFSLILRPQLRGDRLSVITLLVGLAVKDALTEHGARDLALKWPNDVVHQRLKLVGILVEKPGTPDLHDTAVVVGIGINVGAPAIPPEFMHQATALAQLTSQACSREQLLATILEQLERRVTQLESVGFAALLPDIRACDALRGHVIEVDGRRGKACGIGDAGELLVEIADRVETVTAGTVLYA
jgi:BirA family biotin operon repressor/biotin-[acetyl-CoA-carboxylase] ligase